MRRPLCLLITEVLIRQMKPSRAAHRHTNLERTLQAALSPQQHVQTLMLVWRKEKEGERSVNDGSFNSALTCGDGRHLVWWGWGRFLCSEKLFNGPLGRKNTAEARKPFQIRREW